MTEPEYASLGFKDAEPIDSSEAQPQKSEYVWGSVLGLAALGISVFVGATLVAIGAVVAIVLSIPIMMSL